VLRHGVSRPNVRCLSASGVGLDGHRGSDLSHASVSAATSRESVAFGAERIPLDHEERFLQPLRIAPTVMEPVQGEVLGPKIALGDPHDGHSDPTRL